MPNIGELTWKITGDDTQIKKAIKSTETGAKKLGNALKAAFTGAAILVATKRIAELGKRVVGLASDLGESRNAVSVVFGEATDIIDNFAENAVEKTGLTATAFNELSTVIGAQLKQSGLDIDDVASRTIELTRRAADTASIFNVDVTDSLQAYGAALRGESEPARRFGINISDAAVQAEALASGLVQTKGEITDQIKVQARFNLVMQQSSGYAGDFENTSDSLANQTRILKGNISELGASIGEDLIPVTTRAVGRFNEFVSELVETRKQFDGLKDAIAAERDGTATLEQQLQILIARRERYTGATRAQKAALDAEIASIREAIDRSRQYNAIQEALSKNKERTAETTSETAEIEIDYAQQRIDNANRLLAAQEAANVIAREEFEREQERLSALAEYKAELREAEEEAEQERHEQRIANLQSELAFYSQYAGNVGNIFSNLVSVQMAGDDELSARKKQNIRTLYRLQQAANIAQIGVDTAAAIIRQFKDYRFPRALLQSIVIGGMGITQAAVVASTPPPVADGGIIPASPGGTLVQAGEAGRDEAIVPLNSDNNSFGGVLNLTLDLGSGITKKVQIDLNNRSIVVPGSSVAVNK